MPRLNDTQTVILNNAGRRDGGAAHPLPRSLKADAKAVELALQGLLKHTLLAEGPATGSAVWRETPDGDRLALFVTEAGRAAVGMAEEEHEPESGRRKPKGQKTGGAAASGNKASKDAPKERPATRQDTLISLLRRPEGATAPEMMEVSGWQAHSVRGFISGTLKAKLGLTVEDTLIGLLRRPEGATVPEMMEVSGWQAHSVRGFISGTLKAQLGLTIKTAVADGRGRVYSVVEAG